jgi:hypothetical protein
MMAGRTNRPPSNTLLQGQARGVSALMRSYVNLHYGYVQADIPDWRQRSARLLEQVTGKVASLRALDSRAGPLRPGLRGTSYERACCLELPGEDVMAARRRGSAAEVAAELAEALRTGDLTHAVALHRELTGTLARVTGCPAGGDPPS